MRRIVRRNVASRMLACMAGAMLTATAFGQVGGIDPTPTGSTAKHDYWITEPPGAGGPNASVTFGGNIPAIPADFFGPGSDPWAGTIDLQGLPFGINAGPYRPPQADTTMQRSSDPDTGGIGGSDTVVLRIVALSQESVQPIQVTGTRGCECWNVTVRLSDAEPQPDGQLTAYQTHTNGGVFDSQFGVRPKFIFTCCDDPSEIRVLDADMPGFSIPTSFMEAFDQPYVINRGSGDGFYPGYDQSGGRGRPASSNNNASGSGATFGSGSASASENIRPYPCWEITDLDSDHSDTTGGSTDRGSGGVGSGDCDPPPPIVITPIEHDANAQCAWHNPDPCPDCPEYGACCFPDGSCCVLTPDQCNGAGGSYQGDDTTCQQIACPVPQTGACCLPGGGCSIETSQSCAQLGGAYLGNGSDCAGNPCQSPTGACCLPDDPCCDPAEMPGTNGLPPCFEGASCCADGEWACNAGDGSSTCDAPGPVCGDSTCDVVSEDACDAAGGEYQGNDTTCEPDPCLPPTGACCLPDPGKVQRETVLTLDVSGSINSSQLQLMVDGLKACLANDFPQDGTHEVAIVAYNSTADPVLPILVPVTPSNRVNVIEPVLDSLTTGGGTDIGAGIQAARDILNAGPSEEDSILLVGDGGGPVDTQCEDANSDGILICAIAVGDDQGGQQTLETCALATGGHYAHAPSFDEFSMICPVCFLFLGGDCITASQSECADFNGTYKGDGTTCAPNPCVDLDICDPGYVPGPGDPSPSLYCSDTYRNNVLSRITPSMIPVLCAALNAVGQGGRCAELNADTYLEITNPPDLIMTVYIEDGAPPLHLQFDPPVLPGGPTPTLVAWTGGGRGDPAVVGFVTDSVIAIFAELFDTVKFLSLAWKVKEGVETVTDPCTLRDALTHYGEMLDEFLGFCAISCNAFVQTIVSPFGFGQAGDAANIVRLVFYYECITICDLITTQLSTGEMAQIRSAIFTVRNAVPCP